MIVYQVCGSEWTNQMFRTLREAKAYIAETETKDFYIQKCELRNPTVNAMIDIINSQGGSWCEKDYGIVAVGGMWAEEGMLPPGMKKE